MGRRSDGSSGTLARGPGVRPGYAQGTRGTSRRGRTMAHVGCAIRGIPASATPAPAEVRCHRIIRVAARPASLAIALTLLSGPANADAPRVIRAVAECDSKSACNFTVTIRHSDTGWKHYADRFEVLDSEGTVLVKRVLRHPHVHEQPFTRSLAGAKIPANIDRVRVRAHDSVHGYGPTSDPVPVRRAGAPPPPEAAAPEAPATPQEASATSHQASETEDGASATADGASATADGASATANGESATTAEASATASD
jgi:hypothetical protein